MAWLDDRIWAHPKINRISPRAFQAFVFSLAYSSGFGLYGVLTPGDLRKLHVTQNTRRELTEAELWHDHKDGGIEINDWDEHNAKRDQLIEDRRRADRDRKRRERDRKAEVSRGQSRDSHGGVSRDVSRDESVTSPRAPARARTGAPPMTVDEVTKNQQQEEPRRDNGRPPDPAAAAIKTLETAGWSTRQLQAAHDDPARALAWLHHAQADPTSTNPAGLAWTKYQAGGWPEQPRSSIVPGAQGERSTRPKGDHVCPHCQLDFKTEAKLTDHIENIHADTPRADPPLADLAALGLVKPDNTPPDNDPEPGP